MLANPSQRPADRRHLLARCAVALGVVLAALLAVVVAPDPATAAPRGTAVSPTVPVPVTPNYLTSAIESAWIPYVGQDSCNTSQTFQRGTAKLVALLQRTYPDVYAQGAYVCGTDGSQSEHYEGRAIDWMASVKNKNQFAEATAFINWLLAPDAQGNQFAMARRLGVMYVIYNNRIWGGWDGTWEPYNNCAKQKQAAYDNSCHRTHVHISLTWNGATGRTSYWTGTVTPTDYGPCVPTGLAWAPAYSRYNPNPCPRVAKVAVAKGASPAARTLANYSGIYMHYGTLGPAVSAVQRVLGVPQTGRYVGAVRTAVAAFQRSHRLPVTTTVNRATWRALLAAYVAAPTALRR